MSLDIVDAQLHLTLDHDERRLLADMDADGIHAAVLDEFWYRTGTGLLMPCAPLPDGGFRPLTTYVQGAVLRNPDRFSFVQRVEVGDPERLAVVRLLADAPGCRAIRLMLFTDADRRLISDGAYDEVLAEVQARSLPLCVFGVTLPILRSVAARFPDLRILLDHCGGARTTDEWDDVLRAAALPGVHLKWCHPHRVFGHDGAGSRRVQRGLLQAVEAFGADRVIWASDITMEDSGASRAELLGVVRDNDALSDSQKEWILGRAARVALGLPTNTCTRSRPTEVER